MKKYEMFGPNVADKYASAITKNFGLGCTNSQSCSEGYFIIMYPSSVVVPHMYFLKYVRSLASFLWHHGMMFYILSRWALDFLDLFKRVMRKYLAALKKGPS